MLVERECEHCGRSFAVSGSPGRPRKYCRRSCRQRAFEARQHSDDLEWGADRLVRLSSELAALEDRVEAVRDVLVELHRDLDDGVDPGTAAALARLEAALHPG